MTAHAYSEKALVEQSTMEILKALGWATASATYETFGAHGTFGREFTREVTLPARLRAALVELNPGVPSSAIDLAIDDLLRDRVAMGPAGANREIYRLLKDGVKVSIRDDRTGNEEPRILRVIDWEHPEANDFLAVQQFAIQGPLYKCIPDVLLFVNGLPMVVIELKRPGIPAKQAFDENLTSYKHPQNGVPQLFAYNALLIASNGTDGRVGSLTADWERLFEWKRIEREDEPRRVSLEVLLRGTCDKHRLLDLVANFTLFSEHKSGVAKIVGQNHQFLGVNNAIAATLAARAAGHGRAGVFWQTQGSGKSYSMVFYAQKILRAVPGNWTFVVVTDRVELDDQIAKTFAACGAVQDATACHATSGASLRKLLSENHRYVFTLVHKFQTTDVLCDRSDVIVMVDEAHRSQYDQLAMNMRAALPNALFVAFTGTPLIAGEERTREVFGDYVSVYDFQQSVEDGATVPLFYENRTPELRLTNPALNEDLYQVIDDAALDDASEERVQKLLGKQYHLITRDERLDTIAKDIVDHFLGRGALGLAFFLAKIRRDTNLATKAVVFDDPLSSLDLFRQSFTQQEIARIAEGAKQVIVLSHDPFFLKGIRDSGNGGGVTTLYVARKGSGFTIRAWNIEDYCLTQNHKDYFVLRRFLKDGAAPGTDLVPVARAIRPYVEGSLRFRFPTEFGGDAMLGQIISRIREATGEPLKGLQPDLTTLEDLNTYSRPFHHGGEQPVPTPNEQELTTKAEIAIGYVQRG